MKIKVLGTGCRNCISLENNVRQALRDMGRSEEVEKVTEITDIMSYDVLAMPALVVNDRVVLSGRVPQVEEIKAILTHE